MKDFNLKYLCVQKHVLTRIDQIFFVYINVLLFNVYIKWNRCESKFDVFTCEDLMIVEAFRLPIKYFNYFERFVLFNYI